METTGEIRIWEGTVVNNRSVTLKPFLPVQNKFGGMAVVICPGGSYCWLDYKNEGILVAKWLQSQGIAAFVLKYRVQGLLQFITHSRAVFGGHQHPDMIEDLQRAIQLVREQASDFCIHPDKVGVMGFSAGGHLAMSSACFFSTDFLAPHGINHKVSLRPSFASLVYPVVSMSHRVTHKRSRRALLGEWGRFDHNKRDLLSLEKHIPCDCPPVFLVNCKDDPVVKAYNSELLDSALSLAGVRHKFIQYATGGHSFGASERKGSAECRQWRGEFIDWVQNLFCKNNLI